MEFGNLPVVPAKLRPDDFELSEIELLRQCSCLTRHNPTFRQQLLTEFHSKPKLTTARQPVDPTLTCVDLRRDGITLTPQLRELLSPDSAVPCGFVQYINSKLRPEMIQKQGIF